MYYYAMCYCIQCILYNCEPIHNFQLLGPVLCYTIVTCTRIHVLLYCTHYAGSRRVLFYPCCNSTHALYNYALYSYLQIELFYMHVITCNL